MVDIQNSLYLYPSDGSQVVASVEKLRGSGNYREWKISLEMILTSKRKKGFVNGTIERG